MPSMKNINFPKLKLSSILFFLSLLPLGFFSIFTPEENIVVGHTAGQFSVNDAGAATYTIPITVSPGTAGLTPNLSLAYSSQGGNGMLGLGWSLQGLSSISRSSKTLAQDGEIHGVDFSSEDTYSLDGERLRVISGEYGAHEAEYRTEQNSFMRIVSYGNLEGAPESFKVWTKAGLIMEYGYTKNSQINLEKRSQSRNEISQWALNKLTDTKGNYYTINYFLGTRGEYAPNRIDYTGNNDTGVAPYNSIRFSYDDYLYVSKGYFRGFDTSTTKRLKKITTYHEDSIYREYSLDYEKNSSNNIFRLKSVQECSRGDCFEPTTFEWLEEGEFNLTEKPENLLPINDIKGDDNTLFNGDWNGDGEVDLMRLNQETGDNKWYTKTGAFKFLPEAHNPITPSQLKEGVLSFGDYNSDGYTDFVWYHPISGANRWFINNKTDVPSFTQKNELLDLETSFGDPLRLYFADWNGDGLTDVLSYSQENGRNTFFLNQYGNATGFIFNNNYNVVRFQEAESLKFNSRPAKEMIVNDWDGDGLPDILWYNKSNGYTYWFKNQEGNSFALAMTNGISPYSIAGGDIVAGDWNGDGLTDLIWYDLYNKKVDIHYNQGDFRFTFPSQLFHGELLEEASLLADYANSNGIANDNGTSSFFDIFDFFSSIFGTEGVFSGSFSTAPYFVAANLNGDGATDLVLYKKSTGEAIWYLNNGHGSFSYANQNIPDQKNLVPADKIKNGTLQLGGYGDKSIVDLMWYDNKTGKNRWFCNTFKQSNLLTSITNGIGAKTAIEYSTLVDDEMYAKGNKAVFPNVDFQARFPIVKSFTVDDGIGGRNTMTYCYKGATMHVQGRGFRGFEEITMADVTTGIKETRFFTKDYRYISSPLLRTETRLADGTLISEVINTNGMKSFGSDESKIHFSYVNQSISNNYELDGSLVTSKRVRQEYDQHGNVTLSVVDHNDGHRDSTVNTYNDFIDSEKWHLGRLIRAEVHRFAPNTPTVIKVAGFEYDTESGLLVKEITEPDLGPEKRIEKQYIHDAYGNIIESRVIAHNGQEIETRTSYTTFSTNGRFTTTLSNQLGHAEHRQYDAITGLITTLTDANGNTSTTQFDGFGRKLREEAPDGNWMTYAYTKCAGNCPTNAKYYIEQNASNGNPSRTYLDILDRAISTQSINFDGATVIVDKYFNRRGLIDKTSDPYFINTTPNYTTSSFDVLGREVSKTLPGNRIFTTNYNGLVNSSINPLGQTKTIYTNAAGRNTKVIDNDGNELKYKYDAQGNMTQVIDPLGNIMEMAYDQFARKIQTKAPDLGEIQYHHNQFGELLGETDAKGITTTFEYDQLGRLIKRIEPEKTTTWTHDTAPNGLGLVASITTDNGYAKSFTYDDLNRVLSETEVIEGANYTTSFTYDNLGRLATTTYPSGFAIKHIYNQNFFLAEIQDAADNSLIWRADNYNAKGQLLKKTLGNGLSTTYTYDEVKDFLQRIHTGDGINVIQDLSYTFNDIGHLTQRKDNRNNLTEDFHYDNLSRLSKSSIVGGSEQTMQYDVLGNITFKSDVGTYNYGEDGRKPHAVTSITPVNNGVCAPSSLSDFEYTSFDKVKKIKRGYDHLTIAYGAGNQRIVQKEYKDNLLKRSKTYVSGLYEKEIVDTLTREIHYIRAGGDVIATYEKKSNTSSTFYKFWHKDHLGSLQAITDDLKVLVQELSYDAWGKRRNTDGTPIIAPSIFESDRGFTGHEHIDLFELVNMNGRVYDPVLGRFISPDPFVQDITDLQNLNWYTYVLNNPLSFTDPSGYFFNQLFKGVGTFLNKYGKTIAALAVGALIAFALPGILPVMSNFLTTIVSGAAYGFGSSVTGAILGGRGSDAIKAGFKGAVISGLTAGLTFGVGELFSHATNLSNLVPKSVAHGVIQGTTELAQGGQFEHGFLAGAFSHGVSPILESNIFSNNPILSITASAIVGGTASKLGGGKFANGAVSGAFIASYNSFGGILKIILKGGSKQKPSGGSRPNRTGAQGERKIGLSPNRPRKKIFINGRTRIPDGITSKSLIEVKNVARLSYTQQLRDFQAYAAQNGKTFILYTRSTTKPSGPLQRAIDRGDIIHKFIPGGR